MAVSSANGQQPPGSGENLRPFATGDTYRPGAHAGPVQDATLTELVGRVVNDVSDLADRQIELAKQEIRGEIHTAISAAKTIAIGAGIAAAVGLLLVIWLWTAFIWFFNWIGDKIVHPYGSVLGWILGLLIPLLIAWIAWSRFISRGIQRVKELKNILPRTRATLQEDLEWVRRQRTRSVR